MDGAPSKTGKLTAFLPALVLLALLSVINFIDRSNLALAAPILKDELHISTSELGILLSAFFWTYAAMQLLSGWLVDRFDANYVLTAGFLLWSLATVGTGAIRGFTMLLAMRLILGIGESAMVPSWSKILSLHLPEHHRGFVNGVLQGAARFGPAVGTLSVSALIVTYGWRPAFIGIGLISLLWIPAWMRWMPHGKAIGSENGYAPGFGDILRRRSFWGVCIGHFSVLYLLYFTLMLLPFYLVHERHLSMHSMAKVASAYYTIDALSSISTGWLADALIRRGFTPTLVRKCVMAIGHAIAVSALAACALVQSNGYLIYLFAIAVGSGVAGSGPFAFAQSLAGPHVAGKWTGLQNCFVNLGGVVAPALTGYLVDRTGNFRAALMTTAGLLVAGGISWVFVVGKVEQVRWQPERNRISAAVLFEEGS